MQMYGSKGTILCTFLQTGCMAPATHGEMEMERSIRPPQKLVEDGPNALESLDALLCVEQIVPLGAAQFECVPRLVGRV